MAVNRKLLGIYLNDHLAGAMTGGELAKRAARNNAGTDFGKALEGLAREIEDDRSTLERVMAAAEVSHDRYKLALGWTGEKLGRLKLNGGWLRYSPLSRLVEIELLLVGVRGKLGLWRALERVGEADPGLRAFDFAALAARADAQLGELERLRMEAATIAFLQSAP